MPSHRLLCSLLALLVGCTSRNEPAAGSTSAGGDSSVGGAGGASTAGVGNDSGAGGTSAGGDAGSGPVPCARPAGMPAVTLTYDDALPSQLRVAAPLLRQHRLKATFFLVNVTSNPAPWAALRADGHELAAHTFNHPCPKVNTWVRPGNASEDYDLPRMAAELDQGLAMLNSLGQPAPYTFAYPCGITWVGEAHDSFVPLVRERFSAARGGNPGPVQAGVDLYEVPATFSTGTAADLIAIAEQAKSQGSWVVYGFHGIDADNHAIAADAHEALLTYLDQQRDSIYTATFGELAACFPP